MFIETDFYESEILRVDDVPRYVLRAQYHGWEAQIRLDPTIRAYPKTSFIPTSVRV